eukprot:CAMPEP_0184699182 /NCGR_PEP_ID=MMETSP0313-20130426/5541_1 /TAXON_ID=2792 /ORGANISM="Porphyridium aerugineum, Strain SAG 1380-2" /LENGTH=784 /DNA_ID=CAMNT_0027158229 /DNA_START=69 /DNA_END=2423 /DNA_ORIENTATION=-
MVLLHGGLSISVQGALGLWNVNERSLKEKVKQKAMMSTYIDPYFTCKLGKIKRIIKSHTIDDTQDPVWDVSRDLLVCEDVDQIVFEVLAQAKDSRISSDLSLGYYIVKTQDLIEAKEIKGTVALTDDDGKVNKDRGKLIIDMKFQSVADMGSDPEVPWCYFPPRRGNKVTLYGDAHHFDNELPKIIKSNGVKYEHGKAWQEIYQAIMDAKHLVYACGWSIFADISLLREKPIDGSDKMLTNGELFKLKAEQGCRVLLMAWDELLSTSTRAGLMATHDEENVKYFEKTGVNYRKVGRVDDGTSGNWGGLAVSGMWTHHQKSIIVDAPVPGAPDRRRLICFVGGLDITDGRWDTPEHSLFRTLGTYHKPPDFHQACWVTTPEYGPREPWHDIHMKAEGAVSYDVLKNFEDRWKKQVTDEEGKNKLYKLPSEFLSPDEEAGRYMNYDEFVCQFFRSIDERSAVFDHGMPGVFAKKGRAVEASIHDAYCHQIRRAEKFLYIENQYFLGSSHAWVKHADDFALHIIPLEITQKIINKINRDERFSAYILIPMHPEGIPGDRAVQEILYWQYQTVRMMYKMIGDAIKRKGIKAHPRDYLSFYCVGKREVPDGGLPLTDMPPKPGSDSDKLLKSRRCMIYVHSKMMIVDDEYIIIGSANINDRSMAGTRDTEMAIGCFQPYYTVEYNQGKLPQGNIAAFRRALWAEHLGGLEPLFEVPDSIECMRRVNEMAEKNWQMYMQDTPVELKSHLLPYPYEVEPDGDIKPRERNFPDTRASIKGFDSILVPDTLTS